MCTKYNPIRKRPQKVHRLQKQTFTTRPSSFLPAATPPTLFITLILPVFFFTTLRWSMRGRCHCCDWGLAAVAVPIAVATLVILAFGFRFTQPLLLLLLLMLWLDFRAAHNTHHAHIYQGSSGK